MKTHLQVEERTLFRRIDLNYAFVIFALNVIGLINLYSATHGVHVDDNSRLFWQQLVWLVGGWIIYFGVTVVDYQFFFRGAFFVYVLNLMALGAVMAIGSVAYGAQRWLDLGFFRYQPSETMKIALVLVMARTLSQKQNVGDLGYKDLIAPVLITLIPFALTAAQPDLGTAMLLILITFGLLLFIGIRRSILVTGLVTVLIAAPLVWNFGLKEYQKNRVLTFLSPGRDPRGTGYNSIQSKIAVGSGRILGKGFRKGTQSQLEFLPERHTDFIFSVLSEEHGFVGSVTTFGLFVVLFLMGIRIASQARDKFGSLLVIGVLTYLFLHTTINIGMVIGLLPIVGVPLPLLSYGGSSFLTTMLALGLISSVSYRRYLF
jgi:rod shape determining protein RodA